MDGTALAFALACSLGRACCSDWPRSSDPASPAESKAHEARPKGPRQLRAQNALVVTQVALAFVLLVASGLMIRSFFALRAVTPGFTHPEWIQTVRIAIPEALTPDTGAGNPHAIRNSRTGFPPFPASTAAGFASGLPMESEYRNGILIDVEGKTSADQISPNRAVKRISPGLLAAQGTRLVAGRDFTWEDVFGQRRVALVSENMARENWGEPANALGKRIRQGRDGPWTRSCGRSGECSRGRRESAGTGRRSISAGWTAGPTAAVVRRGSRLRFEANVPARKRSFGRSPLRSTP